MEGPAHRPRGGHAVLLPRLLRQRAARPAGHRRRRRSSAPRSRPGRSTPFKFAVFGDWGKTLAAGNPDQANVISQIAASGARFAVTTGDNAYEVGSQKDYGDLYQTGDNTSAVFGPNYWKVAGASLPLFPAIGNHDHNNSVAAHELAAGHGRRHVRRALPDRHLLLPERHDVGRLPERAGTRSTPGMARFYVLNTAWDDTNVGTATSFKNDFDNHWGPNSPQYQWLANDLATHPRAVRFAFWHYPLDSDSSEAGPDTYPPGSQLARGAAEALRRDGRLQRPLPQLPAQHRAGRRHSDPHHRRRRREPRVDRGHRRLQRDRRVRHRLVQHVQRGQRLRRRAGSRHEGPRAPLPARERERHVGDGHADRRAGADVRPDHLQRAGAERQPVADQDRLARPGAGRAAGHLQPDRRQRGPARRDRACRSPTRCPPA